MASARSSRSAPSGAATTLPTAAKILGIGRTLAYELVAVGQFPVPVIRAGTCVIVPVDPPLKLLHADDAAEDFARGGDPDRRLDHLGSSNVDATATNPADSPRPGWRAESEHTDR